MITLPFAIALAGLHSLLLGEHPHALDCLCLPSRRQSEATNAILKVLLLIFAACLRGSSKANETYAYHQRPGLAV